MSMCSDNIPERESAPCNPVGHVRILVMGAGQSPPIDVTASDILIIANENESMLDAIKRAGFHVTLPTTDKVTFEKSFRDQVVMPLNFELRDNPTNPAKLWKSKRDYRNGRKKK